MNKREKYTVWALFLGAVVMACNAGEMISFFKYRVYHSGSTHALTTISSNQYWMILLAVALFVSGILSLMKPSKRTFGRIAWGGSEIILSIVLTLVMTWAERAWSTPFSGSTTTFFILLPYMLATVLVAANLKSLGLSFVCCSVIFALGIGSWLIVWFYNLWRIIPAIGHETRVDIATWWLQEQYDYLPLLIILGVLYIRLMTYRTRHSKAQSSQKKAQ